MYATSLLTNWQTTALSKRKLSLYYNKETLTYGGLFFGILLTPQGGSVQQPRKLGDSSICEASPIQLIAVS